MVKIFVGNVAANTTEEELQALFEEHGAVSDCDILKNYGFVHMNDEDEAQKAVAALHKHLLNGSLITVEYATTKVRNATKIYVGNLPEGVTIATVREMFRPYGKVVECDIVKNYAFVHMQRENDALKAIKQLSNYKMEGQKVYVSLSRSNPPKNARDDYYPPPAPHYPPYPQHAPFPPPRPPVSDFYAPRGRVPPPPPPPPRSMYEHEPYERSIRRDPYAAAATTANPAQYYEQDPYERRPPPPQRPQPASIAARYYRDRSPLGGSRALLPPPPPPPPPPSASYMRSYPRGPSGAAPPPPPPPSSSVAPASAYRRYPPSYDKDEYTDDKYRNGYNRGY